MSKDLEYPTATQIMETDRTYQEGLFKGIEVAIEEIYKLKRSLECLYSEKERVVMEYTLASLHDELGAMIYKHYRPIKKGFK